MMAPTEILARHHYQHIVSLTQSLHLRVGLLTSSIKGKARTQILSQLAAGEIDFLIGTHSLVEEEVQFSSLAFVIIDEQHKFGVAQRSALWYKNQSALPHVLVMTATPIPRTLAMTAYGDLDYSVIDELPPGRWPIVTSHQYERDRALVVELMKQEIRKGRQIYVVFPLIEESKNLDYQNLLEGIAFYQSHFPEPHYYLSVVHGKQKPELKQINMQRFVKGDTQIMLSTTVIEVGVHVANASVMVIESAEKFGLSQLHQLRGRVGRGVEKSYCILLSGLKVSTDAKKRIQVMCQTNDGFQIAEKDLEIRGPGEIEGTKQSGLLSFKLASLVLDRDLLELAQKYTEEIFQKDSELTLPEHAGLKHFIRTDHTKQNLWKKIS